MGDGYFYTLSAIAQSFAALVVLNAIFVIYKLQLLGNRRDELFRVLKSWVHREMVENKCYPNDVATTEIKRMTNEDILAQAKSSKEGYADITKNVRQIVDKVDKNETISKKIADWLQVTLMFNGATILLSLFLLPWRNILPFFLQIIFLIVILLLSFCALSVTMHALLVTIERKGFTVIANIFGKIE